MIQVLLHCEAVRSRVLLIEPEELFNSLEICHLVAIGNFNLKQTLEIARILGHLTWRCAKNIFATRSLKLYQIVSLSIFLSQLFARDSVKSILIVPRKSLY